MLDTSLRTETFYSRLLEPPTYGWDASSPSRSDVWREFFKRMNVTDRRNWLPLFQWGLMIALEIVMIVYLALFFTPGTFAIGLFYGFFLLPSWQGSFYLHRFGAHRTYRFASPLMSFLARNAVIRVISEEPFLLSHHVHHVHSDDVYDPHRPSSGRLTCLLADVNQQLVRRDLSAADYERARGLIVHAVPRTNDYEGYRKWGSVTSPSAHFIGVLANWLFWAACFFALGGWSLVFAIFGCSTIWFWSSRLFTYRSHAKSADELLKDRDFHREDLSLNFWLPGVMAGEWHNNHHHFPWSARTGYSRFQIDAPYVLIRLFYAFGAIASYRDGTMEFKQFIEESRR